MKLLTFISSIKIRC